MLLFFVSDLIKQSLDLEFKRLDNMISEVSGVYNFIVNSKLAQQPKATSTLPDSSGGFELNGLSTKLFFFDTQVLYSSKSTSKT